MPDPSAALKDRPPHPGHVLKKNFLEPLGISVTDLAARLGVSRNTLSGIINERSGISADMALRFSRAFKTTPEFWLKTDFVFDLWAARQFDSGWREVEQILPGKHPGAARFARHHLKKKRLPRL
ncbi:MAG: HigA family addiction module antidote protein [Deltaproteobacteria bacterium]|jgi:addiction module HigA family antidote|nr:HigA family addiction module antidote protein [Deltaproteobacteria bacterium]